MVKELVVLLLVLSCIHVALSLQCIKLTISAKQDPPENCTTDVKLCSYVYDTSNGFDIRQDCAEGADEKLKDTCVKETGTKKIAYCGTDLCNTKDLYYKLCGGLECYDSFPIGRDPKTSRCPIETTVCVYEVIKDPVVGTEATKQNCGVGKMDNENLETCVKIPGRKSAYCGTDKCNTKVFFESKCGGQAGLKSSFISVFGSIIILGFQSR